MGKINTIPKRAPEFTHEGAKAARISTELELRRSVMSCMLWEDEFYENGTSVAERIRSLVQSVPAKVASQTAIDARNKANLRHVPLWILVGMIEKNYPKREDRTLIKDTIVQVVKRADEMGELISLYWKDGKKPLTKQMKLGLAEVFKTFNEYQLAKYDSDSRALKIRDVMFLCHPKPENEEQAELFKRIANKQLATPDTWETQLSGGADKKDTFTRLMAEGRLGALAFLRNLRNMQQSGVNKRDVRSYSQNVKTDKVLPFRFIAAARAVPSWSDLVEDMMLRAMADHEKLPGKTAIVVDNSGSMGHEKISKKSDLDRSDAACALAVIIRELCDESVVIGYGNEAAIVPSHYRGMSLVEEIKNGPGGGTDTRNAIELAQNAGYDRIIVITDEQSSTQVQSPRVPAHMAYFINVASYKNGIGYKKWTHIDGFSESVVDFIRNYEEEAKSTISSE